MHAPRLMLSALVLFLGLGCGGDAPPPAAPPAPAPNPIGPSGSGTGHIAGTLKTPYARLADSVVYVEAIPGRTWPAPAEHPVMDQQHKTFVPHVLPILVGTTVAFPNTDDVRHSVFARSGPTDFDLGKYDAGVVKTERFDAVGVAHLGCKIHHEMGAWIVVCQNPHFVLVPKRAQGAFELRDVPAGRWRLTFFHEKLRPTPQVVEVVAGAIARVEFTDLVRR